MRAAKPNELKAAAFPVLTAKVSEKELRKWFPVRFEEITDPESTPEPSKGALLKLARGPHFVSVLGRSLESAHTSDSQHHGCVGVPRGIPS
jgi:hypothetical protein